MKNKKLLPENWWVWVAVTVAIVAIIAAIVIRPANRPTEITPTMENISPAPVAQEEKTNVAVSATNRVDVEFTGVRPTIKN